MKFTIKTKENIIGLGRVIGYKLLGERDGEHNLVRSIGPNRYPRFHLYVKARKEELIFNLHLDQKQPSYKGQISHSGEYEGEVVDKEAERIRAAMREK